jgi:membrane protein
MLSPVTSFRIVVRAAQQWSAHRGPAMGAALAYYALFSLGPLLVIAVSMVDWLFGAEAVAAHVHRYLSEVAGMVAKYIHHF